MANNTEDKVQMMNANGTTAWVSPDRVKNLIANGWTVVDDDTATEQTATAEVEVKTQPVWVGHNRSLFLAIISFASRAEGVEVDELASTLGISKDTVYLTAGEMIKAHYLAKVKHPVDGRKSIYIATAMPSIWNEEEVDTIITAYRERIRPQKDDDSGELPLMRKKPEQPKECAMAKAMAKDVHIHEQNMDSYQRMFDFMVKHPMNLTQELNDINREYIRFLQDRIKSVQYDCPKCRAYGTVKSNNGAAYCTKCKVSVDGFGNFEDNLKALHALARATKEDD